jgi:copper chaperone NosL
MKSINHRCFVTFLCVLALGLSAFPVAVQALDCSVKHPLRPPQKQYRGQCPVCGMMRSMWARTWITFDPIGGVSQVCSFHCLADWTQKSGREPTSVMLTVYHHPEKAIPAEAALIVIGSSAAGTMSPVSKIVFAGRSTADEFTTSCGGEVVDYARALLAAKTNVEEENKMIGARRLQKGKIVEPGANDNCPVCGMFPDRYPHARCQIKTLAGKTLHFCSTQCMFAFLGNPAVYTDSPVDPLLIWVVDRDSGAWISGRTAFYVIGSTKVFGPMGFEALPFNFLKTAEAFTVDNGGTVAHFSDVTIDRVVPQWKYPTR